MSRKKSRADARDNVTLLNFANRDGDSLGAEELLDEIDNLALLLHEVRMQTDRIEAAADAIGDAILNRLDTTRATSASGSRTSRKTVTIQPKTSPRLRTILPRAADIN